MQLVGIQIVILILIVAVATIHIWTEHPTSPIKYLDARMWMDKLKEKPAATAV